MLFSIWLKDKLIKISLYFHFTINFKFFPYGLHLRCLTCQKRHTQSSLKQKRQDWNYWYKKKFIKGCGQHHRKCKCQWWVVDQCANYLCLCMSREKFTFQFFNKRWIKTNFQSLNTCNCEKRLIYFSTGRPRKLFLCDRKWLSVGWGRRKNSEKINRRPSVWINLIDFKDQKKCQYQNSYWL